MSKWKCEICGSEFENFHAQGFNHKIYCPLCYFKKKNQELKKQLKEWKHHLKCSKEMLDIQGQKGNYDYDEYMLGLYNGMEYIIALFETREPNFISGKNVGFTNNKSQQKEFINYLEDEIYGIEPKGTGINYNCEYDSEEDYINAMKEQSRLNTLKENLQKYKQIIGDDK